MQTDTGKLAEFMSDFKIKVNVSEGLRYGSSQL